MIEYIIITTETFEKEFENILYYIEFFLKEPILSKKFYFKILNSISNLRFLPERYSKLKNHKNLNLHKLIINNYIVIYEINIITLEIYLLHIFNDNQNYLNLL